MSAENLENPLPTEPRRFFKASFVTIELILEPYKNRRFAPGSESARRDAFLYALNSLNQSYLSQLIHGEDQDLNEKSYLQQGIPEWAGALIDATNNNWSTLGNLLKGHATHSRTLSAELSRAYEEIKVGGKDITAIDLEESGDALLRLANFILD